MNKAITAMGIVGMTFLAPAAISDTILGVYAGAGIWQTEVSGYARQTFNSGGQGRIDLNDFQDAEEDNNFLYVALEHPVPVIPNIMLKKSDVTFSTAGVLNADVVFNDQTFNASSTVAIDGDLSHIDGTFYYEILDNYLSLDIGITARQLDGEIRVAETGSSTTTVESFSGTIPMLYLKGQVDLPLTGLYITASGNVISFDGHSMQDLTAGIGFHSDGWVLDIGAEFGIRSFTLELDNLDDVDTDFEISGVYGAITLHF